MTPEDYFLDGVAAEYDENGVKNSSDSPNVNKSPYTSCHSWDLGFAHFVCLNSNNKDQKMMEFATGDNANVDGWIQAEAAWLDADLTRDESNSKTKWTIVYMHLSPFTIIRPLWLQRFIPILEKHRVHVVLCGHNHTYSRSIPIRSGYDGNPSKGSFDAKGVMTAAAETELGHGTISHRPDWNNGTIYIMNQAGGFKLSGKEIIQAVTNDPAENNNSSRPWWYGYTGDHPNQPTYCMIEITESEFKCTCYKVEGIVVKDFNNNDIVAPYGTQERKVIDTITIPYRSKGQTALSPRPNL